MKFNLLLLDANIVIYLFELNLWDTLVNRCGIYLARTVMDESAFWESDDGSRNDIDWSDYTGRVTVFDVPVSKLKAFHDQFEQIYLEKLDPGESEALAYFVEADDEECLISSADKIVFRVLGNLGLGEQGISLEEIFDKLGMKRRVEREFSKKFREEWTRKGFEERLHGYGATDE